jgi:predicted Zn-dependent peptidase
VADVAHWHKAVLGRDRLIVASAGPLGPAEAAAHIDRVFAGLPSVGTRALSPAPSVRAPGKLIVLERAVVQTAIAAGGATGWTLAPDAVRGTLAVRVLGGGFKSRLTAAVRERLGATYGIRASLQQLHPKAFTLAVAAAVDNGKAAAALAAIRGEYERFRSDGVSAEEIEPVKSQLAGEMREQLRRSAGAAQRLRDLALGEFPAGYLAGYDARLRELSAGDINDGIRAHLPKAPLTVVMVTPSAEGLNADCVIRSAAEIARCE